MNQELSRVLILQRVVPHYRVKLFRHLFNSKGVLVVAAREPPPGTGLHLPDCSDFVRTYEFRFGWNQYQCIVPIGKILRELQPVAIIAEFSLQMSSTWHLAILRRLGSAPKLMFWSHGLNHERLAKTASNRIVQDVRRRVLAQADLHLVYTLGGKAQLSQWFDPHNIFVAQNTLPDEFTDATENTDYPNILSTGRMTADKNFPLLIRAFRSFFARHGSARLTIIGDGPDYERCKIEAGEMLGRCIFLPGSIYDDFALRRYFARANLFIIAGAAGLSVNHALLHGVPVMIFEQSEEGPYHHPEAEYVIAGKTGWRVPTYSAEGMASALNETFTAGRNPRTLMGPCIERFVREDISFNNMVRNFEAAIECLRSA